MRRKTIFSSYEDMLGLSKEETVMFRLRYGKAMTIEEFNKEISIRASVEYFKKLNGQG